MSLSLRRLFHRKKEKQERRILRQIESSGDRLQPEYHRATPECPHPERWRMFDSMTAEAEVLEFVRTVVTTTKPELVVETGTFSGISTLWIAEGLKANGRGRVITCEFDSKYTRTLRRESRLPDSPSGSNCATNQAST